MSTSSGAGAKLFPRIIVAVLENPKKTTLFTTEERIEIIREIFRDEPGIEVVRSTASWSDSPRTTGARIVIRGLRAISDFEYEFQMALMNQNLDPELETLFMMPSVALHVPQLEPGQGGLRPGRLGRRPRSARRRTAAA